MTGFLVLVAVYSVCGLITAVVVTRNSHKDDPLVDMSEVAFLPFIGWPAFAVAGLVTFLVRLAVGRGGKR